MGDDVATEEERVKCVSSNLARRLAFDIEQSRLLGGSVRYVACGVRGAVVTLSWIGETEQCGVRGICSFGGHGRGFGGIGKSHSGILGLDRVVTTAN